MKAKEYISDITKCLDLSREWAEAELAAREGVMTMTFTDYQTETDTLLNRLQSVDIDPLLLELKEHSKERIRAKCVSLSRIKLPIRVNPLTYEYADEIPMQYWNEPWAEAYNNTWRLAADFVKGIIDERGFDGLNDLFPSSSDEHCANSDDECHNEYTEELLLLFHGHTKYIDDLIPMSDREKAKQIMKWSKEIDPTDKRKKLIENPKDYGNASRFAKALKDNLLLKESVENFRHRF